ncbi:MAG: SDR family oxidoreductase [Cystobacter sp.]
MPARRILVTGGAGYVGSALVPALLERGHTVTVVDVMMVEGVAFPASPALSVVRGDIRDAPLMERLLRGQDAVIHLAFISNDPEYALDPALGESINWEAFRSLTGASRRQGVRRFIFPSSCSVYGRAEAGQGEGLTEDAPTAPLTDYARLKLRCEQHLRSLAGPDFCPVSLRAATVCGPSPRLRLDLLVNRMAAQAYHQREIPLQGAERIRPCLHIQDMVEFYCALLSLPDAPLCGQVFNAAFENRTARDTAELIREELGADVRIVADAPTRDERSYRVSSRRLHETLGLAPRRGTREAVRELKRVFAEGGLPEPWTTARYYNKQTQLRIPLRP